MKQKLRLVLLLAAAVLITIVLAYAGSVGAKFTSPIPTPSNGCNGEVCATENTAQRGLALVCIQPEECASVMADVNAVWGYHWDRSEAYLSNCPGYMAMCQTNVPTSTCAAWAQAHPEVPILIGNEPNDVNQDDTGPSLTSAKHAALVLAIYSVNPSAEVYILGIHQHDYFDGVRWWTWKEFADEYADNWPSGLSVTGIHLHYYKWGLEAADVEEFNSQMDEYLAWQVANFPGVEILLSEYGIIGSGTEGVPQSEVEHFIRESIFRLNKDFDGYAWFPYKDCELGYPVKPLNDPHSNAEVYAIDWREKNFGPLQMKNYQN